MLSQGYFSITMIGNAIVFIILHCFAKMHFVYFYQIMFWMQKKVSQSRSRLGHDQLFLLEISCFQTLSRRAHLNLHNVPSDSVVVVKVACRPPLDVVTGCNTLTPCLASDYTYETAFWGCVAVLFIFWLNPEKSLKILKLFLLSLFWQ